VIIILLAYNSFLACFADIVLKLGYLIKFKTQNKTKFLNERLTDESSSLESIIL